MAGAFVTITVNALFWQSGPHPAPFFAARSSSGASRQLALPLPAPVPRPAPTLLPPERPHQAAPTQANTAETRAYPDPIAQLLEPSNEVLAVQRVLSAYGYGQIRPTGIAGPDTREAIRRFERSRKLPITGSISPTLLTELAKLNGGPLE